jgi:hypothetical protein
LNVKECKVIESISATGQKRIERLITWCKQFQTPEDLLLNIDAITAQMRFGVPADDFEAALNDLGMALGFVTQRPDKEWREGPDNLWALRDNNYLLLECKNQVDQNRAINKQETGQMNNSCAWFRLAAPLIGKKGTEFFFGNFLSLCKHAATSAGAPQRAGYYDREGSA